MNRPEAHDPRREWVTVILLMFGFGLVGLDRWIIAPLFPAMVKDLGISYQDLGLLVGVLGMSWGLVAPVAGNLADRFGRRQILVPSIAIFSLLSILSSLTSGMRELMMIRAAMGIAEGAFCTACFAATNDVSRPERRGFNIGLMSSAFPLFGMALGPILSTQLLTVTSWRNVLMIVAAPGFVMALLYARYIQEPAHRHIEGSPKAVSVMTIFRHQNIRLGALGVFCAMSGIFTLSALVPSYLLDELHLTREQMGFVTAGIGFGGFLGNFGVVSLSDHIGRKPTTIAGFVLGLTFMFAFSRTGAEPNLLFLLLLASSVFCTGLLGLFTGPIAAEAAPVNQVALTLGIVIGVGEIVGGGIAPAIGGYVSQHFGIRHCLDVALIALGAGLAASFFLLETAPRRQIVVLPT